MRNNSHWLVVCWLNTVVLKTSLHFMPSPTSSKWFIRSIFLPKYVMFLLCCGEVILIFWSKKGWCEIFSWTKTISKPIHCIQFWVWLCIQNNISVSLSKFDLSFYVRQIFTLEIFIWFTGRVRIMWFTISWKFQLPNKFFLKPQVQFFRISLFTPCHFGGRCFLCYHCYNSENSYFSSPAWKLQKK